MGNVSELNLNEIVTVGSISLFDKNSCSHSGIVLDKLLKVALEHGCTSIALTMAAELGLSLWG